jgi:hypothetical protein
VYPDDSQRPGLQIHPASLYPGQIQTAAFHSQGDPAGSGVLVHIIQLELGDVNHLAAKHPQCLDVCTRERFSLF